MERNLSRNTSACIQCVQTFTDVLVVIVVPDLYLRQSNLVDETEDVEALMGAPPKEDLLKVWDYVSKNGASGHLDGVGKREKVRKLMWLLSEARRERKLKFLESSEVICLLRDERQKRLLVRFRAARWHQGKVEVMVGILWQIKDSHRISEFAISHFQFKLLPIQNSEIQLPSSTRRRTWAQGPMP